MHHHPVPVFPKNNNFSHIPSGILRLVLQVLHALLPVLCSSDSSQQMPGARQFAVQQIGGHVCVQGVFQVPTSWLAEKKRIEKLRFSAIITGAF